MKRGIIIAIGSAAVLGIGGLIYAGIRKRKKEEQNAAYHEFREQLEQQEEPEKIKRAALQQAFDPDYWKEVKAEGLISEEAALKLAKAINGAWNAGTFWDDLEEQVYEAFENRKLKSYADVSRLADAYRKEEVAGKDLWSHLDYKLSETEFAKVKSIVVKKKAI